jgi:class 3 adenylate cyclase/tetratricopeptide (TPR) repeat protein
MLERLERRDSSVDIAAWLRDLGLPQYEQAFRENAIDPDVLPDITDDHLKEMGVPIGHRLKLLAAIAPLRRSRAAPEEGASPQTLQAEGERRQVAVLFADLAGYTALSNELGAEEVHNLLERFFEQTDRIVEEHGGRIDKHIGDCIMAVFGAPIARGNDAERAVHAALAIRAAMPALSADLGRTLEAHIGIAAGQVIASGTGSARHREYTITGESVNLASRLTEAAAAGEILVSDAIWRSLAGRLDSENVGTLVVKGFSEPVQAWRLRGLPQAPVPDAVLLLVGREAELRAVETMLSACRANERGQMIHVRGEAGIGKTRFVEECLRQSKALGFSSHMGLVLDFGTETGRHPVQSIARTLLAVADPKSTGAGSLREDAANAVDRITAKDRPFLRDLLGLPQDAASGSLYEAMDSHTREQGKHQALIDLVEFASQQNPVLLVIEDLHWADEPTLESVAVLVDAVERCPALLLVTSRPEGDPITDEWQRETCARPLVTIELGPLHREESLQLAEALVAGRSQLAERSVERAGGNPLYLEQLLRHAEETTEAGVPGSIQSLVQARLDRLDQSDKRALQAASVLGQRFDPDTLAHLLEQATFTLERLFAGRLLQRDGGGLMFTHALIRDAVYDTLLNSRRRELHRRAAAWFADRDLVLHAEHLDRGGDTAAARAYFAAARAEAAVYRHEHALQLTERGLALAAGRDDRFELACLRGDLLHDLGAMAEAGENYREALSAALSSGESCRALIGLAAVKRVTDDLDGAFADLDRAEMHARAARLVGELSRIHYLRGNLFFPRGSIEGVLHEHQLSLELARECGSAELETCALGGLGDAEYMRGRLIGAYRYYRECIAIAADRGFARVEVANRPMAAIARGYAENARVALEDALIAIEAAVRLRHQRAEMIAQHAAYFPRHAAAEFELAMPHVERALALSRQLKAPRFEAEALAFRSELKRRTGFWPEAREDASAALAICRNTAMTYMGPMILAIFARVTSDPKSRAEALREGEALLASGSASHNHLHFRRDAIDVCLETGDWDAAEHHASEMEAYASAEPTPWSDSFVARGRALAAFGRGDGTEMLLDILVGTRSEGERIGLQFSLPEIDAAIAAFR